MAKKKRGKAKRHCRGPSKKCKTSKVKKLMKLASLRKKKGKAKKKKL